MDQFYARYKHNKIDKIIGIEARGFIFGALANKLDLVVLFQLENPINFFIKLLNKTIV